MNSDNHMDSYVQQSKLETVLDKNGFSFTKVVLQSSGHIA